VALALMLKVEALSASLPVRQGCLFASAVEQASPHQQTDMPGA